MPTILGSDNDPTKSEQKCTSGNPFLSQVHLILITFQGIDLKLRFCEVMVQELVQGCLDSSLVNSNVIIGLEKREVYV